MKGDTKHDDREPGPSLEPGMVQCDTTDGNGRCCGEKGHDHACCIHYVITIPALPPEALPSGRMLEQIRAEHHLGHHHGYCSTCDVLAHIKSQRLEIEKLEARLANCEKEYFASVAYMMDVTDERAALAERIEKALALCDKADALLTVRIWPVGANAIRSWSSDSDTQGGEGPYDTMYIPTNHIRAILSEPPAQADRGAVPHLHENKLNEFLARCQVCGELIPEDGKGICDKCASEIDSAPGAFGEAPCGAVPQSEGTK
jgi:rRNA maturation endonuclease Nob1